MTDVPQLAPRALLIDVPSRRLEEVVAFWAGALDATPRWPERDDHPYVGLDGPRSAVEVLVQRIGAGVPRYHVDLPARDQDAAADALVRLGATKVGWDDDHWVLKDPVGLLLCVIPEQVNVAPTRERVPGRVFLDGLFVDVPAAQVETEVAFWSKALGATVEPTTRPETYTALRGVTGPGGDLLVEVQRLRDGAPRFHVDLSAEDVASEASRLVSLGATHVADVETWTTLADPAGNLLCVVPR